MPGRRVLRRINIDHPIRYEFPAFRLKWPLSFQAEVS